MEKEILLKKIENTNHLNELYQLWNEFKAYLENQPSLLELGKLFGFNYHLQEKFNQLSQLFIQEKKYQESIEFHQDFMNYFKDDKYLCPFYKNLALSYFYQDNDQGISYFQELLEHYPYDYEIMDAYFSCLYKQNNLQELKNMIQNLISIVGLSVGILCFSICLYCSRFISEVDSCFSNKELIADINLCTTRGDLYSGIPATTIEELRKLRFDEVQDFTFTVYPRERSYNVEIKEGKELPYDHLMTMEVDSLFRKVFTPRILQGSWEVASNTPNAIILTRSLAKRIFGESENPIGKRMILTQRLFTAPDTTPRTGGIAYTIQAVIEDIPLNTSLSFLEKLDMLTLNDRLDKELVKKLLVSTAHNFAYPVFTVTIQKSSHKKMEEIKKSGQ